MELITDYTQYSAGIHDIRIGQRNLVTNCLLMRDKVEQYIDRQGIWKEYFGKALLIFCDDKDYYSLYYFLPHEVVDGLNYPSIHLEKPVLIEIISQDKSWFENKHEIIEFWENSGFSAFKINKRMKVTIGKSLLVSQESSQVEGKNCRIEYASSTHIHDIKQLWRENLEIIGNKFPADDELVGQINQHQILLGLDKEDNVVATVQFITKGDTGILKHLVVDRKYRKLGLARGLYQRWLFDHPEMLSCTLWVDESNLSAIKLYSSVGFEFDGLISWQLVNSTSSIGIQKSNASTS